MTTWPEPSNLTDAYKTNLLTTLQAILWGDENGQPKPDKEWDADTLEMVAEALEDAGLKPGQALTENQDQPQEV
jgi:hypothetical protein